MRNGPQFAGPTTIRQSRRFRVIITSSVPSNMTKEDIRKEKKNKLWKKKRRRKRDGGSRGLSRAEVEPAHLASPRRATGPTRLARLAIFGSQKNVVSGSTGAFGVWGPSISGVGLCPRRGERHRQVDVSRRLGRRLHPSPDEDWGCDWRITPEDT